MSQDSKDPPGEDRAPTAGRNAKTGVDLFPALETRKFAPVVPRAESRLGTQISIFEPASFDEAMDIVECLRTRAATTICLDKMRKMDAIRLVDFVSGAAAAIDGDFHKLTEQVFVFCPSNIKIVATEKPTETRSTAAATATTSNSQQNPLDYLFANLGTTPNASWASKPQ